MYSITRKQYINLFGVNPNKLRVFIGEEKKKFKERFKTTFSFPEEKLKISDPYVVILLVLGILFVFVAYYFGRSPNISSTFIGDYVGMLPYIMVSLYILGLRYLYKKHQKNTNPFTQRTLDHINTTEPNTKLVIPKSDYGYRFSSIQMGNKFGGVYHQRAVQFSYTVNGFMAGGRVRASSTTTLQISANDLLTTTPITITERDSNWKTIEADTLDECFEKRFTVEGIDVHQLSSDFKKLLVQPLYNIQLIIKGNTLQYSNTDIEHKAAVHSMESMILLIDWGDQVMSALEKIIYK